MVGFGKTVKKSILGIFICLASFFLMSHNAAAIELTRDVNLIQGNFQSGIKFFSWNASSTCSNLSSDVFVTWIGCNGLTYLYDFDLSIPTKGYQAGDWAVLTLRFNQNLNSVSNHSNNFYLNLKSNSSKYADLVDIKVEEFTANSSDLTIYIRFYDDAYVNSLSFKGEITLNPANGTSTASLLHVGETSVFREIQPQTNPDYTGSINNIKDTVGAIDNQLEEVNNSIEDSKNQAENNIQESQDTSNSQGQESQQKGQSLIDVFSGVINAIISAFSGSGSNCVVSTGLPVFGDMDLCSINPPQIVQTVGSLFAVGLFVPFAISYFNRFIGIIRSFQR